MAQDAEVQRVVVGPAVGNVEHVLVKKSDMQGVLVDEEGFVLVQAYIGEEPQYAALTQDGINIITAKRVQDYNEAETFDLLHRQNAVPFNSTLKLPSAPAEGDVANLPKLTIELISGEGNACIKVLHAPSDDMYDNAFCLIMLNSNHEPIYWGDEVTNLLFQ